ncbi:hypothetical protein [Clostridium botulinum]|nr:hypothetical protein [Clostridium botulinum]
MYFIEIQIIFKAFVVENKFNKIKIMTSASFILYKLIEVITIPT